jgi:ABC-2 type transport system permease protein
MRKVWIIARHDYLINLRRAGFIIMTALVPVLGGIALLVGTLFSGQAMSFLESQFAPEQGVLGLVDQDGRFTPVLPEYAEQFQTFDDEASGRDALEAESITALVVIPADYMGSGEVKVVSAGRGFSISELSNSDAIEALLVDTLLQDQGTDAAVRTRILAPVDLQIVSLEDGEETGGRGFNVLFDFMVPYFFGILLFVSVFTSSGYLMRGVSEEKTSRVIEIIISSVSARELLAGKVLGLGALGLTQIAIWITSTVLWSGGATGLLGVAVPLFTRPEILILSVTYYLLGFLLYAVLMGAGGSLGTTMQESQQIAGLVSMIAALPMMLMGFFISNPNTLVARILSWFPLTAPTMMLMRMPLIEVPVIDIVASLITLSLSIPVILWAGAKVFRAGLLMYGKRATLRDVWQILVEA